MSQGLQECKVAIRHKSDLAARPEIVIQEYLLKIAKLIGSAHFHALEMQYSIHSPNKFIRTHLRQLLPSWSLPVLSMLIVLQQCQFASFERTIDTENNKAQLREQFIQFGCNVALKLRDLGHLADIFDPQTGLPMNSPPGQLKLDDVAVVNSALGYSIRYSGPCSMIVHPTWGISVYPSTLVSSAHPHIIEGMVKSIVASMSNAQDAPVFIALKKKNLVQYPLTAQSFAEASQNATNPSQTGTI